MNVSSLTPEPSPHPRASHGTYWQRRHTAHCCAPAPALCAVRCGGCAPTLPLHCPCTCGPARTRREAQAPGGTNAPRRSALTGWRGAVAETRVDATHARQMQGSREYSWARTRRPSPWSTHQSHTIHKHCLPRYSGLGPVHGTLDSALYSLFLRLHRVEGKTHQSTSRHTPQEVGRHRLAIGAPEDTIKIGAPEDTIKNSKVYNTKNQNANQESIRVYSGQIRLYIRTVYRHTREARRRVDRRRLDSGSG